MTTNAQQVEASAGQQKLEEVLPGIDENAMAYLEQMVTDTSELVEASFDDADVTIVGWAFEPGGEERPANDGSGRTFTTQDRIVMKLRLDSLDGQMTRQWISLPKEYVDDQGQTRRRPTNTNSAIGLLLASFAGHGIAGNEEAAYAFKFGQWVDLTGLQYHRQLQEFDMGRNQKIKVHVPTQIYGFDNELRRALKLGDAELKTAPEVPQPVAASA